MKTFLIEIKLKGKDLPDFGLGVGVLAQSQLEVDCDTPTSGLEAYRLLETVKAKSLSHLDEIVSVTAKDQDGGTINITASNGW